MNRRKILSSPILGSVIRHVMAQVADRKVFRISNDFSDVFQPIVAKSEAQKDQTFALRYSVYCEELGLEPENVAHMESDEFDKYSTHCYLNYRENQLPAGTIRLVRPTNKRQKLPIQKFLPDVIADGEMDPNNLNPSRICEISRLAVPRHFRRQAVKNKKLIMPGTNKPLASFKQDRKHFPYIAIGLYFAALSIGIRAGIKHCFVMIEPRLAKSLKYIGLPFKKIGPTVHYFGQRAPYYIQPDKVPHRLRFGFNALYQNIDNAVAKQLTTKKPLSLK